MPRRLDDLARNLGQLFESPAARLEMIRRATPSSRDRILAETLSIDRGDAHALTNRLHERRSRHMTREEVEAGLNEFPPLARVVEGIRQRYLDAVPVVATPSDDRISPRGRSRRRHGLPVCARSLIRLPRSGRGYRTPARTSLPNFAIRASVSTCQR